MIMIMIMIMIIVTPGVSETERQRREESNHLGAKITFIAWMFEVFWKCTN